ncbi:hypothetical protein HDE_06668 [Halotydeus destructor]|nr:hypothetical protein HDE_06668 [Halotydeus destructor]
MNPILLLALASGLAFVAGQDYRPGKNGKEYLFGISSLTYPSAITFCQTNGGRLVELQNNEDYEAIKVLATGSYWIGAKSEPGSSLKYRWLSSNESIDEVAKGKWHSPQPNCDPKRCCAVLIRFDDLLGDDPCTDNFKPLCERYVSLTTSTTFNPLVNPVFAPSYAISVPKGPERVINVNVPEYPAPVVKISPLITPYVNVSAEPSVAIIKLSPSDNSSWLTVLTMMVTALTLVTMAMAVNMYRNHDIYTGKVSNGLMSV